MTSGNKEIVSLNHWDGNDQNIVDHHGEHRYYPHHPRVGVGVLVLKDNKIVLIKRGQEPAKGEWSVPGGLVELGETLSDAAHREVWEECQIRIKLVDQLDVFEYIDKDKNDFIKYHYIVLDYLAEYKSGRLAAASDIDEAQWFERNAIQTLNCSGNILKLVHHAFELRNSAAL